MTLAANMSLAAFTDGANGISLANANADVATSGTGTISLTASRAIAMVSGPSLTTVNGAITLSANQQLPATSGGFFGIDLNNASINSTTGTISLTGRGGTSGTKNVGVRLQNGAIGGTGNDVELKPIDVVPPTITVTTPSVAISGTVAAGATTLQVRFSENVVGGATPGNFELRNQGADGLLGNADDALNTLGASVAANTSTLSFPAIVEGVYRLTAKDTITDIALNQLDGDANSTAGGNWVRDFVVLPAAVTSETSAPTSSSTSAYNAAIGDFNNDGWQDIAYASFGPATIFYNNQVGGFTAPTNVANGAVHDIVTADFNKDGWLDLVGSNSGVGARVTLNNGSGGFGAQTFISAPASWYSVATAPPGSLPGMIALASKPTMVPNPTQTRMSFAHCWAIVMNCALSITAFRENTRSRLSISAMPTRNLATKMRKGEAGGNEQGRREGRKSAYAATHNRHSLSRQPPRSG